MFVIKIILRNSYTISLEVMIQSRKVAKIKVARLDTATAAKNLLTHGDFLAKISLLIFQLTQRSFKYFIKSI